MTTRRQWRNMPSGIQFDLRAMEDADIEAMLAAFVPTAKMDRWKIRIAGWAADQEFDSVKLLRRVLMLLVEDLDPFDMIMVRNNAFVNAANSGE